uniref:Ig-like domain-containing protein n=1 Tax=Oryzias latipes TaxID=8090 RepID=A0A3B3HUG6_ORYLA
MSTLILYGDTLTFIFCHFAYVTLHVLLSLPAVQVGDVVVMLGSSAVLPCHIITNDRLSQITWQKTIKGKAPDDVFLTIQPKNGLKFSNGQDLRFQFIGNFNDKNETLKFSNMTLKDEGSYTCIFSLFPGGTPSRNSQLVILEGNEEVPLATCTAAASKPKAEVRWIKGSLEEKIREELKETRHANGTTTTWSTLLGKPGREMNGQLVKCVISKVEPLNFDLFLTGNCNLFCVLVGLLIILILPILLFLLPGTGKCQRYQFHQICYELKFTK